MTHRVPIVLVLLGLFAVAAGADERLPLGVMAWDGRAPPLRLADSDGRVTDLQALRGHWVMVHFWASWCRPCRKEMPAIQEMTHQLVPRSLRLVLVNTAETDDEVFSFLAIAAPDLTSLMDRDGQVTEHWQPRGLPASFLVSPDGRLRYIALGGRPWNMAPYLRFLRSLDDRRGSEAFLFTPYQG